MRALWRLFVFEPTRLAATTATAAAAAAAETKTKIAVGKLANESLLDFLSNVLLWYF